MKDLETDKEMEEMVQKAFEPESISTEYRARLLQDLIAETDYVLLAPEERLWKKPKLWIAVATTAILAIISYGIWLPFSVVDKFTP